MSQFSEPFIPQFSICLENLGSTHSQGTQD